MSSAITQAVMSLGASPRALAKRARRDRPMWARRPASRATSATQAGLNTGLPWDLTLTGIKPAALMAARKFDLIFAKLLELSPTATGLTAASRALMAAISSGTAAGSFPSRTATRFPAEIRSRWRVAVSLPSRSRAASTPARLTGSAGRCVGAFRLGRLVMDILLSGASGLVPNGLGRTGGDGSGNSGTLLPYRWRFYLRGVLPILGKDVTYHASK